MRVAPCVELDRGYAEILRSIERPEIGVNEEADSGSHLLQLADRLAQLGTGTAQVQASLSGDLLPSLRDQRSLVRSEPAGHGDDVRAGGELQIEHLDRSRQALDISILDVAPILS